jgi:hypothetical protein
MLAFRKINIGIRTQSGIVMLVMAMWYLSLLMQFGLFTGEAFDLNLFWAAVFIYGPFVGMLFALILLISYYRGGRQHSGWVGVAVVTVGCPMVLIVVVLLFAMVSTMRL